MLGAVFSAHGGYRSGQDYVNGLTPAVYAGAGVVAIGALAALVIPGRRRRRARWPSDACESSGVAPVSDPRRSRPGRVVPEPEGVCVPA